MPLLPALAQCGFNDSKAFRTEAFLDLHMRNRHADQMPKVQSGCPRDMLIYGLSTRQPLNVRASLYLALRRTVYSPRISAALPDVQCKAH